MADRAPETLEQIAQQIRRLEAHAADLQQQLVDETAERKALAAVAEKWEPWTCARAFCRHVIPTKAQLDALAAIGVDVRASVSLETLLAWSNGFCSAPHADPNVLPFPAQQEGR